MNVRYIREWSNGSDKYENITHWIEIQAFSHGMNVAKDKAIIGSCEPNLDVAGQSTLETIVNGNVSLNEYVSISLDVQRKRPVFVQIDLGQIYDLNAISIWHGWWFANNVYLNELEVSENARDWIQLYSYTTDAYYETSEGKTWYL